MDIGKLGMYVHLIGFGALIMGKRFIQSLPMSICESNSWKVRFVGCVAQTLSFCAYYHLLPYPLIAKLYVQCQPTLQNHVSTLFQALPATGIYKQDFDQFQRFIIHAQNVFFFRICY